MSVLEEVATQSFERRKKYLDRYYKLRALGLGATDAQVGASIAKAKYDELVKELEARGHE